MMSETIVLLHFLAVRLEYDLILSTLQFNVGEGGGGCGGNGQVEYNRANNASVCGLYEQTHTHTHDNHG